MSNRICRPVHMHRLAFLALALALLVLAIPAFADVGGGCKCPSTQNGCPLDGAEVIDGRLTCYYAGEIDSETLCFGVAECNINQNDLVSIFQNRTPKSGE